MTFQIGTTLAVLSMKVLIDADYGSKAADRRSVLGGLVMYGCVCVLVL